MKALRIEPADNVAVVAQDTRKGDVLRHAGGEVTALEDIGLGHKIAVEAVAQGGLVRKYGVGHPGDIGGLPGDGHCRRSLRAHPQS